MQPLIHRTQTTSTTSRSRSCLPSSVFANPSRARTAPGLQNVSASTPTATAPLLLEKRTRCTSGRSTRSCRTRSGSRTPTPSWCAAAAAKKPCLVDPSVIVRYAAHFVNILLSACVLTINWKSEIARPALRSLLLAVPWARRYGEPADAAGGADPRAHRQVLRELACVRRLDMRHPDAHDGCVRTPVLASGVSGLGHVRGTSVFTSKSR